MRKFMDNSKKFNFKNLIRLSAIGVVAVVGLVGFSRGAEAAFNFYDQERKQFCVY